MGLVRGGNQDTGIGIFVIRSKPAACLGLTSVSPEQLEGILQARGPGLPGDGGGGGDPLSPANHTPAGGTLPVLSQCSPYLCSPSPPPLGPASCPGGRWELQEPPVLGGMVWRHHLLLLHTPVSALSLGRGLSLGHLKQKQRTSQVEIPGHSVQKGAPRTLVCMLLAAPPPTSAYTLRLCRGKAGGSGVPF